MSYIIDVSSEGESGGYSLDGGFVRESFTITYLVCGDTVEDTHQDILLNTPGLPIVGEYFGWTRCKSRTAEPIDSTAMLWEVQCNFDSKQSPDEQNAPDQTELAKPPELRRPNYSWSTELGEVQMVRDALAWGNSGPTDALLNPVGQPYEVTTFRPIANLSINRYELPASGYFDPSIIWDYVGYINFDLFWGFPALTVKCVGISASEESMIDTTDPNNPRDKLYQNVTYNFQIRSHKDSTDTEIGWNEEIPIIGTQEKRTVQGTPNVIVRSMDRYDANGLPAEGAQPIEVFLNTDGTRNDTGEPFWRYVYRYPSRPFVNLGLQPTVTSKAFLEMMKNFAQKTGIDWKEPPVIIEE